MTAISGRSLVSGAAGSVTVTPAERIVLGAGAPTLDGAALDRIAESTGVETALRSAAGPGGSAAIIDPDGDVMTIAMIGDVAAEIRRPDRELFVRPTVGSAALVEVMDDAESVTVGLGARAPADLVLDTATGLHVGTGPGERVFVDLAGADAESTPAGGIDLVDLTTESEAVPEPLPIETLPPPEPDAAEVLGIRCPVDHHNHPDAQYCSSCGRRMGVNATVALVNGPRPPVGLFLADDGAAIPIARDLLVGREPLTHPDVESGRRQPVFLSDETNTVSRHHLAVTLNGWDVEVTDLGSANGAAIVRESTGLEARLLADQPTPMGAGDEVIVGPRRLRLSLHHVA